MMQKNHHRRQVSALHGRRRRIRRQLVLAEGKQARILSRTVPITLDWDITVWEWENPAAVVETYWAVEQQGLALTKTGGILPATVPKYADKILDPFGLVAWPGSVVSAQEMLIRRHIVQDKDVLILGAGVGIEAQAAAVLGARSVLATDVHPTTLQLLAYGAEQAGLNDIISTRLFDISTIEDLPRCDFIVVSDMLYNEQLACQVARRCCEARRMGAIVLVADSQRFVDFESDLNPKLKKMGHAPVKWVPRWLDQFQGSGVMVDQDISYDVKARLIWLGMDN